MTEIVRLRRAIMAVLQPLTGLRAHGAALVRVPESQGSRTLPACAFLRPVRGGAGGAQQLAEHTLLFTTEAVEVTEVETVVPVTSLLGGTRRNLPLGSALRCDPALLGIEGVTLNTAVTGGADAAPGHGSVRQIVAFETLDSADNARDLFHARVTETPALVVAWVREDRPTRAGRGVVRARNTWRIYVVTSNGAGARARGDEALSIIGRVRGLLSERAAVDGFVFSAPQTEYLGAERVRTTASSFIYAMTFVTTNASRRIEQRSEARGDYARWLKTLYDLPTAAAPPLPLVAGAVYPQTPEQD